MELDLKQVNYLRELVDLRPEDETMLDVSKDNTSRKRERSRSQKIRRAVRRHEERVTAPAPKGRRKPTAATNKPSSGEHGSRAKAGTAAGKGQAGGKGRTGGRPAQKNTPRTRK